MWAFRFMAQIWPIRGPFLAHENQTIDKATIGSWPTLKMLAAHWECLSMSALGQFRPLMAQRLDGRSPVKAGPRDYACSSEVLPGNSTIRLLVVRSSNNNTF